LAAGMSIGAYTTSEPDASVQLSCRISMLFWLAFRPYTHTHTHTCALPPHGISSDTLVN
jgi:hypothetical protein